MPDTAVPTKEDLLLCQVASDNVIRHFDGQSSLTPVGFVETPDALLVVPSAGLHDNDEKTAFMNILRYVCLTNRGRRSAFAFEAWSMFGQTPEDFALAEKMIAKGQSIRTHPAAGECVIVICESDDGVLVRTNRIIRDGATITLEAARDDYDTDISADRGTFSHFHVPTRSRINPGVGSFVAAMRTQVGMLKVPITTVDRPVVN